MAASSLLKAVKKPGRSVRGPCNILDSTYSWHEDVSSSQKAELQFQDHHLSGGVKVIEHFFGLRPCLLHSPLSESELES